MKRILIVDDHVATREALRMFLEHHGYVCYEAENGASALSWLAGEHEIDLVITDNQMPGMDGLQLLEKIAAQGRLSNLPVILFSGKLTDELKERALQAGAVAVLAKPLNFHEFVEIVQRVFQSS